MVVLKNTSFFVSLLEKLSESHKGALQNNRLIVLRSRGLGALAGRLGEKDGVDVGKHTTLGNGDRAEQLVELLIVAHSQLDVAGDDTGLLVVAGSVTGKLKDLSSEVLKDGGKVHGGTGTDAGSVLALLQVAADTAHRELKTGLGRLGGGLATGRLAASSFASFACSHCFEVL